MAKPKKPVAIKVARYSLQLMFTHDKKRHYISLGLENNPVDRLKAEGVIFEIERDIEYGQFDPTYQRYKQMVSGVQTEKSTPLSLTDIWVKYVEARSPDFGRIRDATPEEIEETLQQWENTQNGDNQESDD